MTEKLFTRTDAARTVGCSESSVTAWVKMEKVKAIYTVGGMSLFDEEAVEAMKKLYRGRKHSQQMAA